MRTALSLAVGPLCGRIDGWMAAWLQTCAQVLLTLENLANRGQYINARNTFTELLHYGVVPVVNENVRRLWQRMHANALAQVLHAPCACAAFCGCCGRAVEWPLPRLAMHLRLTLAALASGNKASTRPCGASKPQCIRNKGRLQRTACARCASPPPPAPQDTVAVQELRFGDNDTLSAQVAALVQADWLFLLTDVDCLFTANPKDDPDALPIWDVEDISKLTADTSTRGTQWGTGGMATKLTAGRIATAAGTTMVSGVSRSIAQVSPVLLGPAAG